MEIDKGIVTRIPNIDRALDPLTLDDQNIARVAKLFGQFPAYIPTAPAECLSSHLTADHRYTQIHLEPRNANNGVARLFTKFTSGTYDSGMTETFASVGCINQDGACPPVNVQRVQVIYANTSDLDAPFIEGTVQNRHTLRFQHIKPGSILTPAVRIKDSDSEIAGGLDGDLPYERFHTTETSARPVEGSELEQLRAFANSIKIKLTLAFFGGSMPTSCHYLNNEFTVVDNSDDSQSFLARVSFQRSMRNSIPEDRITVKFYSNQGNNSSIRYYPVSIGQETFSILSESYPGQSDAIQSTYTDREIWIFQNGIKAGTVLQFYMGQDHDNGSDQYDLRNWPKPPPDGGIGVLPRVPFGGPSHSPGFQEPVPIPPTNLELIGKPMTPRR